MLMGSLLAAALRSQNSAIVSVSAAGWDPANKHANISLSGANNTIATSNGAPTNSYRAVKTVGSFSADGDHFVDFIPTMTTPNDEYIGFGTAATSLSNYVGKDTTSVGLGKNGNMLYNDAFFATAGPITNGTSIRILIRQASGSRLLFVQNDGTWTAGGNPFSGGAGVALAIVGAMFGMWNSYPNGGENCVVDATGI